MKLLRRNTDLVDRCKNGDQAAYKLLYEANVRIMLSSAVRIMKSQEAAEDIVQESFVVAFNKLNSFRGDASFTTWLKRIVINRCLNEVKKRKLDVSDIEGYEIEEDGEELPEAEYSIETIKAGVAQLAEGYRVVLSLYLFEEMTHKEIGEELGISETTSKTQYHRAKMKLRKILTESKVKH